MTESAFTPLPQPGLVSDTDEAKSSASPSSSSSASPGPVTGWLLAHRAGESEALAHIYRLVYEHLRAVARAQLRRDARGRGGTHTLSTTALVHEAYFKLVDPSRLELRDRHHFLAVASRAMRQVLVDHARKHQAQRRGGGEVPLDLDAVQIASDDRAEHLVALDEALVRLGAWSPRLAQVVELRFFGGLSEGEAATVLGVTDRTVRRDWVKARAWLHAELTDQASSDRTP